VFGVYVTSNHKYIISGSRDKSIKVFDVKSKEQVYHFKSVREGFVSSIVMSPNGEYIVAGFEDKSIKMFDMISKKKVQHFKDIHKVFFSSDMNKLLTNIFQVLLLQLESVQMANLLFPAQKTTPSKSLTLKVEKSSITLKMLMKIRLHQLL